MNKENHDTEISVPDQISEPDWGEVKDLAMQAAAFTMSGDMAKANDVYQYLAIEVMSTLYGPNAVAMFIRYAMNQEPPEAQSRIVLS
jgi:hypothetical protein